MTNRKDRIKGVLLGQAAGDALGAGYEYSRPPVRGKARMKGGGFGFAPGEWTDDTQQAVIVARAGSDPLKVAQGLLDWYKGGPQDVGTTTSASLHAAHGDAAKLASAARRVHSRSDRRVSNGSLMRTGPAALPYLGKRGEIARAAREVSDLTHPSPWAGDACVLWSLAIDAAIRDGDGFDLVTGVTDGTALLPELRRAEWKRLIHTAVTLPPERFTPNSAAMNAFGAALSAIAHTHSLEDALQWAVAVPGDTDTVGAIAGALAGAIYGADTLPDDYYSQLFGWPGLRAKDLEVLALEVAGS